MSRVIFGLLVLWPLIITSTASAEPATTTNGNVSITISPVIFELTANPGDTVNNVLRITNSAVTAQDIVMEVESFTGTETGQAIVQEKGDPAYSLNDWVSFSPKSFTLQPKTTQSVSYQIAIPKDAEPGGRYGSLLASTPETHLNNSTGATTVQKVGSIVLLKVNGDIRYQANISSLQADHRLFASAPINFTARIHNSSTAHIKPTGFLTISNMFGHKVADIPVKPETILPGKDRLNEITWKGPAKMGHYTASMLLVYGDKSAQISAVTDFYVFPWKKALPYLILVIVLIAFLYTHRHRLKYALKVLFGSSVTD